MADYFFDSRVAPGGSGSAEGSPFVDPSYLPTPWRFESGNRYFFARGGDWNFPSYVFTSGFVAAKITVGAYGTGPRPIIRRQRMIDRSECVEVSMVNTAPGTAVNATTNSAGYAIGATVINLAAAGTGTILAGGAVKFAGDTNTYRVASGDADVSNGGSITLEAPGLLTTLSAAPKAITLVWGYTKPATGTNLWRVPRQFFGLFAGDVWGQRVDGPCAHNGADQRLPSAAREWTRADLTSAFSEAPTIATSHVIYSVGNPVDVYGGVIANTYLDADNTAEEKKWCFYFAYLGGGLQFSDIDFGTAHGCIRLWTGTGYTTKAPVLIENSEASNNKHFVQMIGDGDTSFTTGAGTGLGFWNLTIRHWKARNTGASPVSTTGTGICLNNLRIYDFVINSCGNSESAGGVYMDHAYTCNGGPMLVYFGSASGQKHARFWPVDGYPFYQENNTRNLWFLYCFGWNNEAATCHSNNPSGAGGGPSSNAFIGVVGIAKPEKMGNVWDTFHTGGCSDNAEVNILDCVSINYTKFCQNIDADEGLYRIKRNVARTDPAVPTSNRNAVRCYNGYSTANLVVDRNNFWGFDRIINDGFSNTDHSADATNGISSDPAAQLARIPIPTDPEVNYALMLGPGPAIKSGAVDLRYGSRLAAAA